VRRETVTTIIATRTAIYADSQCSAAHEFKTNKLHRITHEQSGEDYLVGGCGYLNELEFFARLLGHHGLQELWKLHFGEHWPPKIMKGWQTDILVVTRDKNIHLIDHALVPCLVDEKVYAMGSGGDWARAALDHGKTAEEAIEYAATRDSFTKGPVHKITFGRKS